MHKMRLLLGIFLMFLTLAGAEGGCGLEISDRCVSYCDAVVACDFDYQSSCENSCQLRVNDEKTPFGESCILNDTCDAASLCIMCDQYADKLDTCELSSSGSSSACVTNLEGGADESAYQCVIDARDCEEVPNCGI